MTTPGGPCDHHLRRHATRPDRVHARLAAFLRSSFQRSMAKHGHWVRVEWLLLLLGAIGCLQLLLELLTASSLGATTAARATPHHHDDGHVASEARAEPSVEMQHGDHHHETRGSAEAGAFCSGMPMVMGGMQGFSRESCVVLFFAQWQVTSVARMWLAACGVLLLAITYEYLKALEREAYEHTPGQLPLAPGSGTVVQCGANGGGLGESRLLRALLHGLNIAVAYLCMFVAMTFNPLLFLMQISGFVAGHYLFGPQPGRHGTAAAFVAAGGDPCCD